MIKIRKSAIFAAMALAALAAAAQDGLLLRRTLTEGTTETYVVESVSKQVVNLPNGMGEQEMESTMAGSYLLKTGKIDAEKKTADLEFTFTIDKMESSGMMGGGAMGDDVKGKPVTMKGTIDERSRITFADGGGAKASATSMLSGQSMGANSVLIELPDKPVKIGDTWEVVIPKGEFTGKEDQKLVAKLVGEKEVDGKPAYVVSTEGTYKVDMDLSKAAADAPGPMKGQKMLLKGTIDTKSDGVVEKSTGRTLRVTTKMKQQMALEIPDMGFNVDVSGTTSYVVTLKP
jgi:hypothetical protein